MGTKIIYIYDFYSHNNGGWLKSFPMDDGEIYIYIFHFQCHGHWWPGNTRSQGISDHDTDLFTSDSRCMLEVSICNYDYWKHAHTHMTVQNKWSYLGPSIASQMIYQGSMSLQYNYNHVRWLWWSKNRSKVCPWHDSSLAMPSVNLWLVPDIILFVEIFIFFNTTGTFLPYSTWVCMFQSSSIYVRGLVLTHWCLLYSI